MFVDFNKVFKNKNQTELTVPKAVVDYMNQSLPEGVKYVAQEDGTCIVTSTTESLTIGGFTFEPTEEQKKILGKNYTQEDVLEYFYNVQQRIPLKLEKEGYILLNGKEFPVEKMAYNLLIPIKYVSGSFCMFPPKFPDPFHITVGCEKYERVLLVSRIPNNSVSTGEYESNKEEPLYIHYLIDDKKKSFTLNISYSLAKAKHIRDIVESTSIYNAFLDGTGIFLGKNLRGKVKEKDVKGFNPKSIAFWEKVLKIEEYLNVNFIPPDKNVDTETQYLVEQLYQNLINEIPTRYNQRLNSVEGKWKFDNEKNKSLDGSIYFEFESEINTELFGVKLHLFALTGIFNTSIDIQEINSEKQKIIFHDESNEKKQFSSIICFKTEKELKEYKEKDHNKIVELFREAKRPYEYL